MIDIEIDIISDVVCPWCYLGQRRLQLALGQVADDVRASVHWKPYQLDPNAPAEGYDAMKHLAAKLGGVEAVRRSHEMLGKLAAEIDLPIALEKAKVFPNTLDAHRLIHWAGLIGADLQDRVAHALFQANFVDGLDVGDQSVLAKIAADCGMNGADVAAKLASDADRDHVQAEIANAQRMGVTGVPCFIVDRQYAITGAQSVEVFVNALRQIAELKRKAAQ
ncbi:DsbA family oxidoreductase [Rhizobium sp. KVB221]|uniref:DsbA family oxidoreductase n=1 Tax=Rhizobium setariae TaxID=2801340 RepID=A0A936YTV8_9HYPH|nr:DsbA family oxidoreductase [Rhizobium setariae]MBL0372976.1 DsbA family oxidoreductase [Rhizobium setariae]